MLPLAEIFLSNAILDARETSREPQPWPFQQVTILRS